MGAVRPTLGITTLALPIVPPRSRLVFCSFPPLHRKKHGFRRTKWEMKSCGVTVARSEGSACGFGVDVLRLREESLRHVGEQSPATSIGYGYISFHAPPAIRLRSKCGLSLITTWLSIFVDNDMIVDIRPLYSFVVLRTWRRTLA